MKQLLHFHVRAVLSKSSISLTLIVVKKPAEGDPMPDEEEKEKERSVEEEDENKSKASVVYRHHQVNRSKLYVPETRNIMKYVDVGRQT